MITSKENWYDHVVISVDADKEFDKIQHWLMIKNSQLRESYREIP